jgi:hypothetical protein
VIVGFVYPFFEGIVWNQHFGVQAWIKAVTGDEFHDFAGSVVVHAMGGWIALPAVVLLGARYNRYRKDGVVSAHPPSSIPFLALGSWILIVGWFGFNVMSAQTLDKISGLVAVNSLMAMVGGTLAALVLGKNDPGFVHNGPLAGLVAVCAGSDLMHPMGALVVGAVAGRVDGPQTKLGGLDEVAVAQTAVGLDEVSATVPEQFGPRAFAQRPGARGVVGMVVGNRHPADAVTATTEDGVEMGGVLGTGVDHHHLFPGDTQAVTGQAGTGPRQRLFGGDPHRAVPAAGSNACRPPLTTMWSSPVKPVQAGSVCVTGSRCKVRVPSASSGHR